MQFKKQLIYFSLFPFAPTNPLLPNMDGRIYSYMFEGGKHYNNDYWNYVYIESLLRLLPWTSFFTILYNGFGIDKNLRSCKINHTRRKHIHKTYYLAYFSRSRDLSDSETRSLVHLILFSFGFFVSIQFSLIYNAIKNPFIRNKYTNWPLYMLWNGNLLGCVS